MRSVHRPRDLAARFGGEEFGVILPQTASDDLPRLASAVVGAVGALNLPHDDTACGRLTISAGGATCTPRNGEAFAMLIEAADKALYEAKRTGRNRAVTNVC